VNMIRTFALAIFVALLSSAGHAAIVLHSNTSSIAVGDEFLVDVILELPFAGEFSGDELLAFGFDLQYDMAAFELTGKSVSSLFDDDTPYLDVDLAGSAFPGIADDGATMQLLLGQLSFKALSAGLFNLIVAGDPIENPNLGLIYLGGEAAILAQSAIAVQPVPVPAAGLLYACALLALRRLRRC
jgi:hypothetical protein